ncbi:uncharacterized protein LOC129568813 [Sitodiplosis mosellana]|uniref:uncharacterized protein LOC129568813 n=1 Tax=Sitodiplosis mosellana TaxID=263140 RepID=UPI0024452516|nr:uncharacterized protein LOC129568813 [Sitodiplosis mosellana]
MGHQSSYPDQQCASCSNADSPPKIFKLTIDCFDEIFEYLSMKDLHSLGQTCKTMQQVCGEYFKRTHSAAEKFCARDGIYTTYSSMEGDVNQRIQTSCFNQFMPCISHYYGAIGPIHYLQKHVNEFISTNHIYLVSLFINHEKVELIREILPQIEIMQIRNCSMSRNFYELMLKYCENLKCIYLQNADSSFNGKHEWLMQDYPQLEHLELMPSYPIVVDELKAFFERNPKVKRFSTTARFLWINRNEFLNSKVQLNVLEIKAEFFTEFDESGNKILIWDVLNRLHAQRFYKRLFIYIGRVDQELSNQLASMGASLETLCIRRFKSSFSLPLLSNLKELILLDGANATDMAVLAKSLKKIQRLYVDKATVDDILPFIRQSTQLSKIKLFLKGEQEQQRILDQNNNNYAAVEAQHYEKDEKKKEKDNIDKVEEKSASNWRIIDLVALNEERKKLVGARKVTIYVRDDVFLATKWAAYNGDINLSLIEMGRSDSYEWNHHF